MAQEIQSEISRRLILQAVTALALAPASESSAEPPRIVGEMWIVDEDEVKHYGGDYGPYLVFSDGTMRRAS